MHYQRVLKYGEPGPVGRKKIGRMTSSSGYTLIYVPDHPRAYTKGYVPEHRHVMEQHLGRYLKPRENVHHINGIRDDNRLENLELWVKPQPQGQRVEDLVHWVLTEYGDEVERQLSAPTLFAVGE